jgi:DNA-3-methyladenine glycosylase II
LGGTLQNGSHAQSLTQIPAAESLLAARDFALGQLISSQPVRWPVHSTEDPLWGLLRIVMAQQITTRIACRMAERALFTCAELAKPTSDAVPDISVFRTLGLSQRRAECCVNIVRKSDEIRAKVQKGQTWEEALTGIKGIGPWTISVFRIMVLRDPDVLPTGDVGLQRAIANIYGPSADVEALGESWRPFRSVACWYLWKTLGNEQLG